MGEDVIRSYRAALQREGFVVVPGIFGEAEVDGLLQVISTAASGNPAFRKTTDLFAIRQFMREVPEARPLLFGEKLKEIIVKLFGERYFLTKSIYFDKPAQSNWFVAYHQDLTIAVDAKADLAGFGPWTVKPDSFSVRPPLEILESSFTVRVHLDDTDENNGALKVIPKSHLEGIRRPEEIDRSAEGEATCCVPKGGLMIMKPLLLHASGRTKDHRQRRVIHIEFSDRYLPEPLRWAEKMDLPAA